MEIWEDRKRNGMVILEMEVMAVKSGGNVASFWVVLSVTRNVWSNI